MSQKGSKCKCEITNDSIFTANENFDEISMNSSQDHSIDRQLQGKPKSKIKTQFCGTFCKKIGPKDQRKIILECLRVDMNNIESGTVLIGTESTATPMEVQVKCSINKLKRYIIDAKWWAKWCDFSNFDQNDLILKGLEPRENDINPLAASVNLKNYLSSKRFESTQLYQKPGRIENESLLAERSADPVDQV